MTSDNAHSSKGTKHQHDLQQIFAKPAPNFEYVRVGGSMYATNEFHNVAPAPIYNGPPRSWDQHSHRSGHSVGFSATSDISDARTRHGHDGTRHRGYTNEEGTFTPPPGYVETPLPTTHGNHDRRIWGEGDLPDGHLPHRRLPEHICAEDEGNPNIHQFNDFGVLRNPSRGTDMESDDLDDFSVSHLQISPPHSQHFAEPTYSPYPYPYEPESFHPPSISSYRSTTAKDEGHNFGHEFGHDHGSEFHLQNNHGLLSNPYRDSHASSPYAYPSIPLPPFESHHSHLPISRSTAPHTHLARPHPNPQLRNLLKKPNSHQSQENADDVTSQTEAYQARLLRRHSWEAPYSWAPPSIVVVPPSLRSRSHAPPGPSALKGTTSSETGKGTRQPRRPHFKLNLDHPISEIRSYRSALPRSPHPESPAIERKKRLAVMGDLGRYPEI